MTSLLPSVLYETEGRAPAPSKDFHHLAITKTEVIWKSRMISLHPDQEKMLPREERHNLASRITQCQACGMPIGRKVMGKTWQIQKVFGKEVLDYSLNLCQGKFDLLVRMPDNIILQIFPFLDLDDIGQRSKTCKKFQKLCSDEKFWEKFRTSQDKHAFDTKKIGITIYKKKLLAFHQNAASRSSHGEKTESIFLN
ncbi:F-box only protein 36-like isoform X1 [Phacochoerus africanus]|uniref:F-box only protein 36-like isoform X1 n=1 Tax=Phacochoerus africanus TaxID=41426 RepID=UPI001FDA4148|nr:F-box only protein 36-like isoform X1 [Phacochoerus africanus]